MNKICFDCEKYLSLQSEKIIERMNMFDGKLYLEFGGKLFDDYHAERVLPGFKHDIKVELLKKLKDNAEVVLCISAKDIESNKVRSDYGITYETDLMRLIDKVRKIGIAVNSVVITQYKSELSSEILYKKLKSRNIKVYIHTHTKGYPADVHTIVSDNGYGANPYIETTKQLVIVTAPGASSGKLATCMSQLYHEYKMGIKSGYAKFETFPVWNLPLDHPINIAYEAATANIKDVNMIDSFHLAKYNQVAVNYNRDIEIFPVIKAIFDKITGREIYSSPTDMGVNMVGHCIGDDEVACQSAKLEIIRRYYKSLVSVKQGIEGKECSERIEILMNKLGISENDRKVIQAARDKADITKSQVMAIELEDGEIITGRSTELMSAPAAMALNALKKLSNMEDIPLMAGIILEPMLKLKKDIFKGEVLSLREVLFALSLSAATNPIANIAISKLDKLKNLDAHCTNILTPTDEKTLKSLKINYTSDPIFYSENLYVQE